MTIIGGNTNTGLTLSPAAPEVTLTGNTSGFGEPGVKEHFSLSGYTFSLYAFPSLYAPQEAGFNIVNMGQVNNDKVGNLYPGMLLGAPGVVVNDGIVSGGSGIDIRGTGAGAYVRNNDFIGVTGGGYGDGPAIYMLGEGGISNAGTIEGGTGGIYMLNGGIIDNTGAISGRTGIGAVGTVTLENSGRIAGLGGNALYIGGFISNASGGKILSQPSFGVQDGDGIKLLYGTTLENAGLIAGASGVYGGFLGGDTVQNYAGGTIAGSTGDGVALRLAGTVQNVGLITGAVAGVMLSDSGFVGNTGTIAAPDGVAVIVEDGGGIFDSGVITGGATAIAFSAGFENLLGITPGAVITGAVDLNGILTLGGSGGSGKAVLSQFENLEGVVVAPDSSWHLHGALPAAAGIFNDGTVFTTSDEAAISGGGAVYNYGLVKGPGSGVSIAGGYVYNAGVIAGGAAGAAGIALHAGYVVNAGGGTVSAAVGISLGSNGGLYNYGVVQGGVTAGSVAAIYNYAGGTVTAGGTGVSITTGVIYNAGYIGGGADAIRLTGGTVTNFGTIMGGQYAVRAAADADARMILSPTAVTDGDVDLGGAGALNLDAGARTGTASASQFKGVYDVTVAARAHWELAGNFTADELSNNGTILESKSDTLSVLQLAGRGTIAFDSVLDLDGYVDKGSHLAFAGRRAMLNIEDPGAFSGTIQRFGQGDTIDLSGIALSAITGLSFANGVLTLQEAGGTIHLAFADPGGFGTDTFGLVAAGTGIDVTLGKAGARAAEWPTMVGLPVLTL